MSVGLVLGGGAPRNGKVLRTAGVAECWARPGGTVVVHIKAWGKELRTKKGTWRLMMGVGCS